MTQADLASLVVTVTSQEDTTLPLYAGRAVFGLLLRWVDAEDAGLAQALHDASGAKPYTCSDMIGMKRQGEVRILHKGKTAWFRMTGLQESVARLLLQKEAIPPKTINIDGKVLDVVSMTTDAQQHPWAGCTQYYELASPYLMAQADAPHYFNFSLASPTAFKQNNLTQPLPLPDLVFGSLADRWQSFSTIGIHDDLRVYCKQGVVLNRFSLKSRLMRLKGDVMLGGSVGKAGYRVVRYDRYWQNMLAVLADYAFYAGIGRYTSVGLGRARRVN